MKIKTNTGQERLRERERGYNTCEGGGGGMKAIKGMARWMRGVVKKRVVVGMLAVVAAGLFAVTGAQAALSYNFTVTNGADTVTFSLPASPIPTAYSNNDYFDIGSYSGSPITFYLNGAAQSDYWVRFYNLNGWGGGFEIDNGYNSLTGRSVVNVIGAQLYSGSESAPTFLTGVWQLSPTFNDNQIPGSFTVTINPDRAPVPIPGAVWLLGSGLVGLVGVRRRMKGNVEC